jgi:hypothetical protein
MDGIQLSKRRRDDDDRMESICYQQQKRHCSTLIPQNTLTLVESSDVEDMPLGESQQPQSNHPYNLNQLPSLHWSLRTT